MTSTLSTAKYGKDNVRVFKIVRNGPWHTVVEYTVQCYLEGDIETSYTQADNSVVVATDSIKNTIYVKAKESPNAHKVDIFAGELAQHFIQTYSHIHKAHVYIIQHKWSRMIINERAHPHSFFRDGDDVRVSAVTACRKIKGSKDVIFTASGGIKDLLVLKSTGSGFVGFIRDRYTTLEETNDRILSTAIDATWVYGNNKSSEISQSEFYGIPFDKIHASALQATLDLFALDESASVQATMYKMSERIIKENKNYVIDVSYALPNKHYLGVDLEKFGLNNTGKNQDIFMPVSAPNGYISATFSRSKL